jgi:hypothetical protein
MASASASMACARSSAGLWATSEARRAMRAMAQARFTAVGRVALSTLPAAPMASMNARVSPVSRCACCAMAYAAVMPMAGAPRTTMSRMAEPSAGSYSTAK